MLEWLVMPTVCPCYDVTMWTRELTRRWWKCSVNSGESLSWPRLKVSFVNFCAMDIKCVTKSCVEFFQVTFRFDRCRYSFPTNMVRNKYVIIMSKWRFDVMITYLLRSLFAGLAVVMPVRYECDSIDNKCVELIILETGGNNKTEEIGLATMTVVFVVLIRRRL